MNAIVSLCHFCEVHGPSIMFCTQAFHSADPQQILDEKNPTGLENSGTYYFTPPNPLTPSTPLTPGAGASFAAPSTPTPNPNPKTSDNCEACRSISTGQTGFISNDHDAKVSYVSSQYPHHPQVFSMVRQACVRSLSCEVCPGREGPIFFGDEHRGHVLCHTFFIKDSQARGFQRWYSVIVAMMDKIYLLNSWPFLVQHLRTIIDSLQDKAAKVYEQEQAKCPQRAHRLTMNMTPENFLHHRGGNKPARSLVDLTNDKNVFSYLHQRFTWILKAGGQRLTERILEAPPTEDSIIDFEKQEETEEGFVKLFSKKDMVDEKMDEGATEEEEEVEADDENCCCPVFQSLRHVIKVLGYQRFHDLAHHVVMGNQIVIRGQPKKLVRSLIDCLKKLLPKGCCRVIYYSKEYEDSWKCNFLGMPPGTGLPSHATMYVVLDIVEPEEAASQTNFSNYMFCLETPMQMPEKAPTVLMKLERALMNDRLGDSVVEQCLICIKEEWMNKVKVLFKFTKAGGNRSDDDTRRLLQVVKAQDEDKAVLKFWMTGLSVQYRNHMLSSAVQQYV